LSGRRTRPIYDAHHFPDLYAKEDPNT